MVPLSAASSKAQFLLYWTWCSYSTLFPWGKCGGLKLLTASVRCPTHQYLNRSFVKAFPRETVFQQDKWHQEEQEDCVQTLLFWEGQTSSSRKLGVQPHWRRRKLAVFEITCEHGDEAVLEVDWYTLFRNESYLKTAQRLMTLHLCLPGIENISLE